MGNVLSTLTLVAVDSGPRRVTLRGGHQEQSQDNNNQDNQNDQDNQETLQPEEQQQVQEDHDQDHDQDQDQDLAGSDEDTMTILSTKTEVGTPAEERDARVAHWIDNDDDDDFDLRRRPNGGFNCHDLPRIVITAHDPDTVVSPLPSPLPSPTRMPPPFFDPSHCDLAVGVWSSPARRSPPPLRLSRPVTDDDHVHDDGNAALRRRLMTCRRRLWDVDLDGLLRARFLRRLDIPESVWSTLAAVICVSLLSLWLYLWYCVLRIFIRLVWEFLWLCIRFFL